MRIDQMRIVQALRKLTRATLKGFNDGTQEWDSLLNPAILESSGRWISERVGFNARRVLLTEKSLDPYRVVKVSNDDVEHILYSEQRNVQNDQSYLYDYTVLDKTDTAQAVTITTTDTASGMGGDKTETLSTPFPVHMVRFASTRSEEQEFVEFSRLYAFAPGSQDITEDMELAVDGDRYIITEAVKELLCLRLSVTRR